MLSHRQLCIYAAREFMNVVWNDKKPEFVSNVMTSTTMIESPIQLSVGTDSFNSTIKEWLRAFPTLVYKEMRVVSDDNKIIIEWAAKGKHLGEFLGLSATGKSLTYQGRSQFTFVNDKVSHYASIVDIKNILEQLMENALITSDTQYRKDPREELYEVIPELLSPFLTRRQVECIALSTLHLSVKEIAIILKIQSSTVQTHLKRSFELLNVSNTKMLISYLCDTNTLEVLVRMGMNLKQKL